MYKWVAFIGCIVFVGCSSLNISDKLVLNGEKKTINRFEKDRNIFASFDGATIEDVIELLPEDISVCVSESVRFRRFSMEVNNVDVDTFLLAVNRSLGCSLEVYGQLYCFMDKASKKEDLNLGDDIAPASCVMFVRMPYYKDEEIKTACALVGSQCQYINGDNYIVRGELGSLVKTREMLNSMLDSLPCEYGFEMIMISKDYLLSADLGISLGASGVFDMTKTSTSMYDWQWKLISSVVSDASLSRNKGDNVRHVCGVFREKSRYTTSIGDEIPYVKRAILDSGSAVDSSIEYVQVGFSLDIGCKGGAVGICDISLNVQDIGGYIKDYPIKHGSTLKTEFVITGNDKKFVGSFQSESVNSSLIGKKLQKTEWLVFVRVIRSSVGQSIEFKR